MASLSGPLVLLLHLSDQLPPEHADASRRVDADPDLRAVHLDDEEFDVRANKDPLTGATGDD